MTLLVKFSIFIACIATTIGIIGVLNRELFLKLPNGFILWFLTGGPMPPYIVPIEPFHEPSNWLKDGDVIVTAAIKSGTTWMLFCSHQVRIKGDDETYPFIDVSYSTPWPEFIQTVGDTWEIQREKMNSTILADGTRYKDYWDHPNYPFRIFKSHNNGDQFGALIGKAGIRSSSVPQVKFLAMVRNGLDQITSVTSFVDGSLRNETFRKMWGGAPPVSKGSLRTRALRMMKLMKPGGLLGNLTFPYVNTWWEKKDEDNVLLLHYADAKNDLPGTITKIAKFYGVKLSKKEHQKIVGKCSFDYMKKHEEMFRLSLPLNPNYDSTILKSGGMMRKGGIGDGEELFTEEEKESWRKIEEREFGDDPAKLHWARYGGGF